MEPTYSMSAYAVFVVVGLSALAARGFTSAAAGTALGVAVVGMAFEVSYKVRRHPDRALPHRRALDRVVRRQWLAIALVGTGVSVAFEAAGSAPLGHASPLLRALPIGLVVAATTIYVSSLVDWYWILPKVSGMVGLAPCERTGGERFAGVTKIWFFHRAAATTVVTFVVAGVPGYMAGSTGGHGGASAAWVVLGSALAIGYNSVNNGLTTTFRYAFNPRIFVGDIIRVRPNVEDAQAVDAYVVDVSIQGFRYQVMRDGVAETALFADRGTLVSIDQIARTMRSPTPHAACKRVGQCQAINWYCFRNPNASTIGHGDAAEPVAYEEAANPAP